MEKLFEKEGFKISGIIPLKFDSFYVSMLSEKYKTGKINVIKSFMVAMKSNLKAKTTGNYSSLIYMMKK
jgi:hypothetical protein